MTPECLECFERLKTLPQRFVAQLKAIEEEYLEKAREIVREKRAERKQAVHRS